MKPKKWKRMKRVVLYLQGGAIQGASDLPPGFEVEVRDYDTDGSDRGLKRDEDGNVYLPLIFGGPMVRIRRMSDVRKKRRHVASPALLAICRKLHDALSDFLESPDGNDVDRKAALRAITASFTVLAKAEPGVFGLSAKRKEKKHP